MNYSISLQELPGTLRAPFPYLCSGSVTCLALAKPSKVDPLKPYYSAADICELYQNPKNAKVVILKIS